MRHSLVGILLVLFALNSLGAVADAPAPSTPEVKPLKVPSEYKRKIIKGEVRYCTVTTIIGSRFPKTLCVNEDELRALVESRENNRDDLRRSQSVCGSSTACGST